MSFEIVRSLSLISLSPRLVNDALVDRWPIVFENLINFHGFYPKSMKRLLNLSIKYLRS